MGRRSKKLDAGLQAAKERIAENVEVGSHHYARLLEIAEQHRMDDLVLTPAGQDFASLLLIMEHDGRLPLGFEWRYREEADLHRVWLVAYTEDGVRVSGAWATPKGTCPSPEFIEHALRKTAMEARRVMAQRMGGVA